jgi:hypothetical protein
MRRTILIWVLVVTVRLLTITQAVMAQSGRGALTGVVRDAQGLLTPGVELVATNTTNGEETRAITTSSGVYRMPYLEPGKYKVTASLKGFKTAVRDNVDVLLAQTVTLDFILEVGDINEAVTVTSETPLLEASTAEIGINASDRDVHSWPIFVSDGTRQLQDFVFRAMPGTQGSTFEGTINGGQTYSHEILIEGISLGRMDINGGSNVWFTATMDAVSEFRLQTGALSSQYGNTQTAVVNFGLRSGTNTLHGTVFWFNQTNRLNAASWSCKAFPGPDGQCHKATVLLNNFGATAGGPLKKDRTHWFFSYEGHRQSDWSTSGSLSLPIGAFKKGDFSKLFDPSFTLDSRSGAVVGRDALGRDVRFGQIYDPATSRQLPDGTWIRDTFLGNIIPQDRFSRVTKTILNYDLPDPQRMQLFNNNLKGQFSPRLIINNWEGKIDHVINNQHKASGVLIYNGRSRFTGYKVPGLPFPGPAMVGDATQVNPGYMLRLSEDWTVSPTRLNHMALGYNRFRDANLSNANLSGENWQETLGMQGVGTHSFPQICFAGQNKTLSGDYSCYGAPSGHNSANGSTIFLDDFTWIRGAHSFRFGGELRRYYKNDQTLQDTGSYAYHNEQTGLPGSSVFGDSLNATGFCLCQLPSRCSSKR